MSSAGALCAGFVSAFPIQHAAISTLGDPFAIETVAFSDLVAAALDEAQLDLGVGPCWDARASRRPVRIADLQLTASSTWPGLHRVARAHGIHSVYAFPMTIGALDVGVVDLYASEPDALGPGEIARASAMAGVVALDVLQRALDADGSTEPSPRRIVHQASGMVVAQLQVTPENALLIIRAHAFATDRTVREVAEDIIARRIDFSV